MNNLSWCFIIILRFLKEATVLLCILAVINFFTKDTLIKKVNVGLDMFACLLQCITIWFWLKTVTVVIVYFIFSIVFVSYSKTCLPGSMNTDNIEILHIAKYCGVSGIKLLTNPCKI